MFKKYFKIILLVWLVAFIMLPHLVSADNAALGKLQDVSMTEGGYQDASGDKLFTIINTVISGALSILGVVFLILMVYAGYNWMMARGEEEKVTKAKETITRAIVGIIIVVAAYAISIFVMDKLAAGTLNGGGSANTTGAGTTPAATQYPDGGGEGE
ncbi:MAG: pilin [Patescibacteria group bacterium]|nr:pilin [Patescibacteria group bacterium]